MKPENLIFGGLLMMGLGMVMYPNPDYATILFVKVTLGILAITMIDTIYA